MIRRIDPSLELSRFAAAHNAELVREQINVRVGQPNPRDHCLLDDADPTVVIVLHPALLEGGLSNEVYIPWLLGQSARIDSGELFLLTTQYLIAAGFTIAHWTVIPGTNAEKAARAVGATIDPHTGAASIPLAQALTKLQAIVKPPVVGV